MTKKEKHSKCRAGIYSTAVKTAIAALAVATAVSATGALPALADQSGTASSAASSSSSVSSSTSSDSSSSSAPSSTSSSSSSSSASSSTSSSSSSSSASSSTSSSSSSSSSSTPSKAAAPLTDIDSPAPGAAVGTSTTVSGWALNASGISRVDIYAFDQNNQPTFLGSVSDDKLTARPDVQNAFPQFNTLNSGYSCQVNTTVLIPGTYSLGAAGIGNDGTVQWTNRTIKVVATPALTQIDSPSAGAAVGTSTTVSGWALNASGISRVDIYAFNQNNKPTFLGSAGSDQLTARPDVQNAFLQFNTLKSGYSCPVDTSKLSTGTYTLSVAGIGTNGTVQWATRTIKVITASALTQIDFPSVGATVGTSTTVSGWALNVSGINRVDIYAFDKNNKPTFLGSVGGDQLTARPDVQQVFPQYDLLNSGYSCPVNTAALVPGAYTLGAAGIGNDGSVQWANRTIKVTYPQPLTDIDIPSAGSSVSGTINVSGWALNASGISRVDVYAYDAYGSDPIFLGSVPSKDLYARPDVQKAFASSGYANADNSGYSLSVDTTQLWPGSYTLAVAGIGNSGTVQWATKAFTVASGFSGCIDSPKDLDTVSGSFDVTGWALGCTNFDSLSIVAIDQNLNVYGLATVTSSQMYERPDVENAFAGQPFTNLKKSGFTAHVDTNKLAAGDYVIGVIATKGIYAYPIAATLVTVK